MGSLAICFLFYLVGAFPTGFLVGRMYGLNIVQHGSGNVGATNLSRVLGKKAGIITLVGDMLKGYLPLLLARQFGFTPENLGCLGLFLILGHCFSLPPLLKGGKGVATAEGVYLGLSPVIALFALLTFTLSMAAWRIVSLSSILAALLIPIYAMIFYPDLHQPFVPWLAGISAVSIFRHRENLQRLIQGEEKRFEFSRKKK